MKKNKINIRENGGGHSCQFNLSGDPPLILGKISFRIVA